MRFADIVAPGDALLIKIDTEGYELDVFVGMEWWAAESGAAHWIVELKVPREQKLAWLWQRCPATGRMRSYREYYETPPPAFLKTVADVTFLDLAQGATSSPHEDVWLRC